MRFCRLHLPVYPFLPVILASPRLGVKVFPEPATRRRQAAKTQSYAKARREDFDLLRDLRLDVPLSDSISVSRHSCSAYCPSLEGRLTLTCFAPFFTSPPRTRHAVLAASTCQSIPFCQSSWRLRALA